ncbi:MAG TPA: carboxypeptidase-like regulatory domain-containing protein [archaeon]|nr:carboxypeptidase-like regulatory domain-containing protein [archaeon]
MKLLFPALLLIIFLAGCPNLSESNVSFHVSDDSGNAVPDARISLVPENSSLPSQLLYTGADGNASVAVLSDFYNVTVSKEGFYSFVQENADMTKDFSAQYALERVEG